MDYTRLTLADVRAGLEEVAREAEATFGRLDERQLNWRPEPNRWSVAQCFDHLIASNRLMLEGAEAALRHGRPRTLWERLPVMPALWGRMLIRSQAPTATRRFTTAPRAQPAMSDIPADIIERFVAQHRALVARVQMLDGRDAARAIMTSPFITVITYSVVDGLRLIVAHDWRHVEQARRLTRLPDFPKGETVV